MAPPNPTATGEHAAGQWFATTHWSVVQAACIMRAPQARAALETLCRNYWYPLYAFVRRRGHGPDEAQDLTQDFFADLIERESLRSVDRGKGRFRSFLLGAMQNHLATQHKKAQALKRGGQYAFVSIDEQDAEGRYLREPAGNLTPERIFERRWALTLLENTLAALHQEYLRAGKLEVFEALQGTLSGDQDAPTWSSTAPKLGLTEGATRVAAHRLRRRYGELLRDAIAHTVSSPEEIEDEIHHLFRVLQG